jgi:hypothetical protein
LRHELQAFEHQAATGVGEKGVETQKGVLKVASNDVVEIDHSHQGAGVVETDQAALVVGLLEALEIEVKFAACERRVNPLVMQGPTFAGGCEKGVAIFWGWRANEDAGGAHGGTS